MLVTKIKYEPETEKNHKFIKIIQYHSEMNGDLWAFCKG